MIYLAIGLIVGLIMGLTGAGGAMISIPLFIVFLNASLKEATVLSLVAVVFGTAVNLIGQLSDVNKKIVLALSISGAVANYLSLPLKSATSDSIIAGLLAVIGSYSIWSVWGRSKILPTQKEENNVTPKAMVAGAILGLITTLTGLGGGVILVPILIKVFGKDYESALPTSLGTILFISLTSFGFQAKTALSLITVSQLALIGGGSLLAFFLLKVFLKRLNVTALLKIRQTVFTTVTVYSVVSVIIKAM